MEFWGSSGAEVELGWTDIGGASAVASAAAASMLHTVLENSSPF